MKEKAIFTKLIKTLKRSGKTDDEIGKILFEVAKYSGRETYNFITLSLTKSDKIEIEKIENEKEAKAKMEELFRKRTGMTIDMLVGKIQTAIIENSGFLEILKMN